MGKARYLAPWHRDMEELTAEVGGVDLEKLGEEGLAAFEALRQIGMTKIEGELNIGRCWWFDGGVKHGEHGEHGEHEGHEGHEDWGA